MIVHKVNALQLSVKAFFLTSEPMKKIKQNDSCLKMESECSRKEQENNGRGEGSKGLLPLTTGIS